MFNTTRPRLEDPGTPHTTEAQRFVVLLRLKCDCSAPTRRPASRPLSSDIRGVVGTGLYTLRRRPRNDHIGGSEKISQFLRSLSVPPRHGGGHFEWGRGTSGKDAPAEDWSSNDLFHRHLYRLADPGPQSSAKRLLSTSNRNKTNTKFLTKGHHKFPT